MTKAMEVPPFVPTDPGVGEPQASEREPMVVMTVRISPEKKRALNLLWRRNGNYTSVSHMIQTAVDEFLAKHA